MKRNLITQFLDFFRYRSAILWRRIYYLFFRNGNSERFFDIEFDDSFANSVVKIRFNFPDLIYAEFPQVGKKIYNGVILLNAAKLKYPYKITIHTASGKTVREIPQPKSENLLNSDEFSEVSLNSFKRELNLKRHFRMPVLNLFSPEAKVSLIFPDFNFNKIKFVQPNQLETNSLKIEKLKFKKFKTSDFL